MKILKLLIFCALSVVLSGCVLGDRGEPDGANIQVGDALPDFRVTLNDGTEITTQSLAGKVSLILFIDVTCSNCMQQIPAVENAYQAYKDNADVVIFAVSREQGADVVAKYWADNRLTMPYSAQDSRYIYSLFARSRIPRIYISDRSGVVQYISTDDPESSYDDLKNEIDALLQ